MKVEKENENKELEEVKKVVRSLLLSTKHGLTVNELCSEYNMITCHDLPYRKLGYYSPVDLVKDMPDVVRPTFQSGGVMLLKGIADESTAHIRDLVRGQRSSRHNTKLSVPQPPTKKSLPKRKVSSFIQSKIYDLIKNYPRGLELRLFENAYMHEYHNRLNPQLQGFTSIRGLLESCTDIIKIESNRDTLFLYPVKNPDIQQRFSSKAVPFMPLTTRFISENKVINDYTDTKKSKIPEEMKIQIFTVLSKRVNGMFAARFPFEFKACHKQEFDIQVLGFNSVIELMSHLPELVVISRPTEKSDWLLTPKVPLIDKCASTKYTVGDPGYINDDIEICVSYIVEPSLFWIQLTKNLSNLYKLMEEMTNFYHFTAGSKYTMPKESLTPGQPCAALYEDDQWYRAVIRNILSPTEVNVFYVDYGNELDIEISSLCLLKDEYIQLPSQAFKAKLYGVKPTGFKWSKEDVEKFYELTCDQHLYATIREKEPVLSIDIMDSQNENIATMFKNEATSMLNQDESIIKVDPYLENEECNPIPTCEIIMPDVVCDKEKNQKVVSDDIPPCKIIMPDVVCDKEKFQKVVSDEASAGLVKCLPIAENYILHLVRYENTPYVISTEISCLFWEADILRQMLHQKAIQLNTKFLLRDEHKKLFSALAKYHINGILNGEIVKPIISVYELTMLPQICSLFESKYENAKTIILNEIQLWSNIINEEDYWAPVILGKSNCQEQSEETFRLQALMFKRKRLFHMIFLNDHSAPDQSM